MPSLKVTEFEFAGALDGSEIFGIIQVDANVQTTLEDVGSWVSSNLTFATVAEFRALTTTTKPVSPAVMAEAAEFITLVDAATIEWDMEDGFNAKVTLGDDRDIGLPTNPKEGITYTLKLIQDATGTRVVTWPAEISFGTVGLPTLSTAAGKKDIVYLQCLDAVTPEFRAIFSGAA
jgi:hypothetical protein